MNTPLNTNKRNSFMTKKMDLTLATFASLLVAATPAIAKPSLDAAMQGAVVSTQAATTQFAAFNTESQGEPVLMVRHNRRLLAMATVEKEAAPMVRHNRPLLAAAAEEKEAAPMVRHNRPLLAAAAEEKEAAPMVRHTRPLLAAAVEEKEA
ncbi:hypothetical protein, partial [Pseudogulbenkiania ferrooxidans]|uniref:hypothetical protein n=1 Tax=Pseudogulbenkiania ferrooxidans TaxID=549169 RepID=UPI00190FA375